MTLQKKPLTEDPQASCNDREGTKVFPYQITTNLTCMEHYLLELKEPAEKGNPRTPYTANTTLKRKQHRTTTRKHEQDAGAQSAHSSRVTQPVHRTCKCAQTSEMQMQTQQHCHDRTRQQKHVHVINTWAPGGRGVVQVPAGPYIVI